MDRRQPPLMPDLNEPALPPPPSPTPREAYDWVVAYHRAKVRLPARKGRRPAAAKNPGVAGVGSPPLPCALCRKAEIEGTTVVCDACERGFHLSCVQAFSAVAPPPPAAEAAGPSLARTPWTTDRPWGVDWICAECEERGKPTARWKLGPVREIQPSNVNAEPPSEMQAAASASTTAPAGVDAPSRKT